VFAQTKFAAETVTEAHSYFILLKLLPRNSWPGIHRVQKKRCHWFFCCNFYKYWRIFI